MKKQSLIKPNVFWIALFATAGLILLAYFAVYLAGQPGDAAAKVAGIVLKTAFVGSIAYTSGVLGIGLAAAKVGTIGKLNATLVYLRLFFDAGHLSEHLGAALASGQLHGQRLRGRDRRHNHDFRRHDRGLHAR